MDDGPEPSHTHGSTIRAHGSSDFEAVAAFQACENDPVHTKDTEEEGKTSPSGVDLCGSAPRALARGVRLQCCCFFRGQEYRHYTFPPSRPLLRSQHDFPHRAATGALDAGQQFDLCRPAAATIMAHPGDKVAERPIALRCGRVGLGEHPDLAASVALDPEEPRREGAERLAQSLGRCRQRIGAVAAPVPARDRPGGH